MLIIRKTREMLLRILYFEIHKILQELFSAGGKMGIMEKNPAVDATLPKRTKKNVRSGMPKL